MANTDSTEIDELLPSRGTHQNTFWYFAGVSAAALLIGCLGLAGWGLPDETLLLIGSVGVVGCILFQVIR